MRSRILAWSLAGLSISIGAFADSLPIASKVGARQTQHVEGSLTATHDSGSKGVVEFQFTVDNPTANPVHFDFDTAEQFDVTIADPHGVEVWRWSQDRAFAQRMTAIELKPGQSKVYTARWNTAQVPVHPPGAYTATARMIPVIRPAVRGGLLINPSVDPNNVGRPIRTGQESGSAFEVNVTPVVSASTKFTVQ